MPILYCAIPDIHRNTEYKQPKMNKFPVLSPTDLLTIDGKIKIPTAYCSLSNPRSDCFRHPLNILSYKLKQDVGCEYEEGSKLTVHFKPMQSYAYIYCLNVMEDFFNQLKSAAAYQDELSLDPSKFEMIGVYGLPIDGKCDLNFPLLIANHSLNKPSSEFFLADCKNAIAERAVVHAWPLIQSGHIEQICGEAVDELKFTIQREIGSFEEEQQALQALLNKVTVDKKMLWFNSKPAGKVSALVRTDGTSAPLIVVSEDIKNEIIKKMTDFLKPSEPNFFGRLNPQEISFGNDLISSVRKEIDFDSIEATIQAYRQAIDLNPNIVKKAPLTHCLDKMMLSLYSIKNEPVANFELGTNR